jgi:hypothetical protein
MFFARNDRENAISYILGIEQANPLAEYSYSW